ncbi:MAG: hypothetical protein ABMA15_02980 [Vicinamibacterales bacterium]
MLTRAYYFGLAVLMGLVTFVVAASASPAATLAWSLAAGTLAVFWVRLLGDPGRTFHELGPLAMAAVSLGLGGAVRFITNPAGWGWPEPLGLLFAVGAAWGIDVLVPPTAAVDCFICKQPAGDQPRFTCPRCSQSICAKPNCWLARKFRCRSCDERDVVIFPSDRSWWQERVGPRLSEGACGTCYKEAFETDLRACGRCQWAFCRRCWDTGNGQCTHCDWVIPDLPASLRPFMPAGIAGKQTDRHARR